MYIAHCTSEVGGAAAVTGLLKNAPAFTVVWNPEAIRVDLVTKRLFNAV